VTWMNCDSMPAVAISTDDQFAKSTLLDAGQNFSGSLETTSDFPYLCSNNSPMMGEINFN
jgi:hypothetical protein